MVAAILVMFMQAGFAFLEAGLTRMKNVGHVAVKNVLVLGIASVVYYLVGFGIAFGDGGNGRSEMPIHQDVVATTVRFAGFGGAGGRYGDETLCTPRWCTAGIPPGWVLAVVISRRCVQARSQSSFNTRDALPMPRASSTPQRSTSRTRQARSAGIACHDSHAGCRR